MGSKLDIVNKRKKILYVLKDVIVSLHIKSWMPQLNLLNLFTTVAHVVQPLASVVVHNVMELICLLRVACKRKAEVKTAMPSRGR